jgi:hypothetical protein
MTCTSTKVGRAGCGRPDGVACAITDGQEGVDLELQGRGTHREEQRTEEKSRAEQDRYERAQQDDDHCGQSVVFASHSQAGARLGQLHNDPECAGGQRCDH